ncbi:MAG: phasin family protein [Spirochaetota bacterium]
MSDSMLKDVFYTSVGLILKGKEKVEEAAKRFVADHPMNKEEGEKFVRGVMDKAEEAKNDLTKMVEEAVEKAVHTMGLVTKKQFDELEKRLKESQKK